MGVGGGLEVVVGDVAGAVCIVVRALGPTEALADEEAEMEVEGVDFVVRAEEVAVVSDAGVVGSIEEVAGSAEGAAGALDGEFVSGDGVVESADRVRTVDDAELVAEEVEDTVGVGEGVGGSGVDGKTRGGVKWTAGAENGADGGAVRGELRPVEGVIGGSDEAEVRSGGGLVGGRTVEVLAVAAG